MPRLLLVLWIPFLVAACQPGAGESVVDLAAGWNRIEPGGDTTCSDGSPYAFYVRPGDPDRLLVYFQGGGACWSGETCDRRRRPPYDPVIDAADDPARAHGIFALDHPENPVAGYSMVFVPYCTGDVYLGDSVATYDVPATDSTAATQVTVRHRGYANTTVVLDWTAAAFDDPETVFVTGGSAGAIAAPFYAARIADMYPQARLEVLGDAAGGYRLDVGDRILRDWGTEQVLPGYPEYEGVTLGDLTFETFYTVLGRRRPDATLAQYNTAEDDVQRHFLHLLGVRHTALRPLLDANHADIRGAVGNFRAFTAGGELHTILTRPEFYTYAAGGHRLRDWVASLAAGDDVPDVSCTGCAEVDTVAAGP